ncbi:zinc finger protein 3-like isoform X1 [Phyllopteryx taeniolatus]|uniref:zinc finger protein 3-like isoform X1 n=1 Tax=Phyllopteryx taeniolatus TaxID=161469 RepID=UPI002AD4C508|nr:zinc finger protein 3-like isoform X1 [Phyllopteryx taeniolatus]
MSEMSLLLTSQVLREQLSVIMAALSKAAVLDICELLERGLTGLREEVSRSQQENRELRSRLSLIESVVVRGSLGGGPRKDALEEPEGQRDGGGTPLPDVVLIKDEDSDCEKEDAMSAFAVEDSTEEIAAPSPARRRKRKGLDKDSDRKSSPAGVHNMATVYSLDSAQLAVDNVAVGASEADVHLVEGDVQLPADQLPYFPSMSLMEPHLSENVGNSWSEPTSDQVSYTHFEHDEPGGAFGLKMVSVSGSAPPDCDVAAFQYRDGEAAAPDRGRRHVCRVCNKTFATVQSRDVHMRIHTGERPFGCQQCGKRFTQSAHLKSHQNIHTGARPYACTLCPRTFLAHHPLNMHLKKCHTNT